MIDLLFGTVQIANLPDDAQIDAMTFDFARDAIGIRLYSRTFPEAAEDDRMRCDLQEWPLFEAVWAEAPAIVAARP